MSLKDNVAEVSMDNETVQLLDTLKAQGINVSGLENIDSVMEKVLSGEASLQEIAGVSDEALEAMYFIGYTKYRNKRYKDAADIFGLIVSMDPFHYNALFGLASSKQMLKEYQNAIFFYYLAAPYADGNPAPLFHSGECFLAMQERELAKESFTNVLDSTSPDGKYTAYVTRAKTVLENLG